MIFDEVSGMKTKNILRIGLRQYQLFLMILPAVVWLFIFQFYPLWGWYMAFVDYKLGVPFFEQQFVGFRYFIELFNDYRFYNAFKNTVIMSVLNLTIVSFIMPVLFALILNEIKLLRFKKLVQSVSYLPHFVSWVVVSGIVIQSLSPSSGIINQLLLNIGLIKEPINFLAHGKYFYGIVTISTLWKAMGWNSIIYIAAITSVDQELYEAAVVDGATRLQKIFNITLPSILPTIIIIFIISISGLVGGSAGYEAQLLLRNNLTVEKAEVLYLYSLTYGINMMRFSFGTAVGIFTSVISVSLMLIANFVFRRISEHSLF
jgi:putative aldouronate transport system permease protein